MHKVRKKIETVEIYFIFAYMSSSETQLNFTELQLYRNISVI